VFVLDEHFFRPADARRTPYRIQFLLESVASLAANLAHAGSHLVVVGGRSVDAIPQLVRRWKVDRVVAQSWVAPIGRERDRRIAERLHVPLELFDSAGSSRKLTSTDFGGGTNFHNFFPQGVAVFLNQ